MICYASRTGTKRNLDVLRAAGWRLMISATGVWRTEGFRYAIDNGAWTAYQQGTPFDRLRFMQLVSAFGADADFVVIPDVVGAGRDSLAFSKTWISTLIRKPHKMLLLAVQDGMTPKDVSPTLRSEWKDATIASWGQFGYEKGIYVHVGRVNTKRRLALCESSAIHSIDGSGPSRFALHAKKMTEWAKQSSLRLFHSTLSEVST